MPLPDGWSWDKEDSTKVIPAGGSVTAKADYSNSIIADAVVKSLIITVTRDKCVEDLTVLYTRNGEYAPGCITDGNGHTECSICGDTIKENIKVPATGHTKGTPVIAMASKGKDGNIISHCIRRNKNMQDAINWRPACFCFIRNLGNIQPVKRKYIAL